MKKGFTVTEILITIGIVGVVAALVLPNMVSKINRSTVGITLARAVELTEKGFGDMLNVARENATRVGIDDPASISTLSVLEERFFDLDQQNERITLDRGMLMDRAQSYIGVDDITNDNGIDVYLNNFNVDLSVHTHVLKFKKLNAFLVFDDDSSNDGNIADNPDVVIRKIYFDTNGENPPNTFGEDIFLFGLTDSGHLVPAGSQAYTVNLWDAQSVPVLGSGNDQRTCIGSAIPPAVIGGPFNLVANPSARLSCTARVVRDGWRVTYSY